MWNNPNDPMPIKTTNMAGLQKWEETEDYIIYIDKDAVMTTVAKYAPGSYQTFMERKADVDNSRSLLKGYNIEWTQKDDSDLFIQCNNEALQKLESQAMMLPVDREEVQPVALESRTVPTTYECCFRVGNDSIYVGEGYENYAMYADIRNKDILDYMVDKNGVFNIFTKTNLPTIDLQAIRFGWGKFKPLESVSFSYEVKDKFENFVKFNSYPTDTVDVIGITNIKGEGSTSMVSHYTGYGCTGCIIKQGLIDADSLLKIQVCLTKTSTPKPFVKSVMPNGKLAFVTNAGRRTHSLIIKGANNVTSNRRFYKTSFSVASERFAFSDTTVGKVLSGFCSDGNYFSLDENGIKTALYGFPNDPQGGFVILNEDENGVFSQLLIYKANLTETELKSENSKDIKLATNNTQMHTQI